MSAEGSVLSAVKPWSSFQCTGIHHAVRAPTYKGDEHLAYALNKSMAPVPLPFISIYSHPDSRCVYAYSLFFCNMPDMSILCLAHGVLK